MFSSKKLLVSTNLWISWAANTVSKYNQLRCTETHSSKVRENNVNFLSHSFTWDLIVKRKRNFNWINTLNNYPLVNSKIIDILNMGRGEQFHCEQEPFGTNTVAICFISRKPLIWYLLKTILINKNWSFQIGSLST